MERFYHIRAKTPDTGKVLTNGGATVLLRHAEGFPLHVEMRVAHCNPVDVYCKETGRAHCTGAESSVKVRGDGQRIQIPAIPEPEVRLIHLKDLPYEFGKLWRHVHRKMHVTTDRWMRPSYEHLVREWLPNYAVMPEPAGGAMRAWDNHGRFEIDILEHPAQDNGNVPAASMM